MQKNLFFCLNRICEPLFHVPGTAAEIDASDEIDHIFFGRKAGCFNIKKKKLFRVTEFVYAICICKIKFFRYRNNDFIIKVIPGGVKRKAEHLCENDLPWQWNYVKLVME